MGCKQCGAKLDILRAHRLPSYCSNACRQRAYRQRNALPAELKKRDRWVSWEPRIRNGASTKVPVTVDGRAASSTNPATWASFAAVRRLPRRGFVLGDGIGCIDLDNCLVKGVPTPAAARLLARLPQTYIEISPSGDGLHVWGRLPEGRGSRRTEDGLSVERYSAGRYITVTGRVFAGSSAALADLSGV